MMSTSIRVSAIALVVLAYALSGQNLQVTTATADAVVVARPSGGVDLVDGVGFRLTVVRTLHGEPLAGQTLNVTMRLPRHPEVSPRKEVTGECGLFTLTRTPSGWEDERYREFALLLVSSDTPGRLVRPLRPIPRAQTRLNGVSKKS